MDVQKTKLAVKIALLLLFLLPLGFADTDYVSAVCLNDTSLETTITTWNVTNSVNTTTLVSTKQCAYGCDTEYNACFESGLFTFELGFMIALMFMSFISLHAVKVLKEQNFEKEVGGFHYFGSGLKVLFFALALMFQVFIFMRLGSLQDTLNNSIINDIGGVAVSISQVLFWLVFIILFFMFIFYFMDFMGSLSQKKLEKQKEKDDEYE